MNTSSPCLDAVRVLACRIARTLREHPRTWCQHYLYSNEQSCLLGQIQRHVTAVAAQFNMEDPLQLERETRHAFCVVAGLPHRRKGTDFLAIWNDQPGRTVEEVISLCDRVADACAGHFPSVPALAPLPTFEALRDFLRTHHATDAWDESQSFTLTHCCMQMLKQDGFAVITGSMAIHGRAIAFDARLQIFEDTWTERIHGITEQTRALGAGCLESVG